MPQSVRGTGLDKARVEGRTGASNSKKQPSHAARATQIAPNASTLALALQLAWVRYAIVAVCTEGRLQVEWQCHDGAAANLQQRRAPEEQCMLM